MELVSRFSSKMHHTLTNFYLQSIEYEDVHDPASKGIQGEGAVKFSIHIENDESFEEE